MKIKIIICLAVILPAAGAAIHFFSQQPEPYDFKNGDILINAGIITPDREISGGSLVVRGEHIVYAGDPLSPSGDITIIEHDGRIYPGLVNTHDHWGYNLFPQWFIMVPCSVVHYGTVF